MVKINSHYQKLAAGYLFPEIGRRVRAFQAENPQAKIIRLGIGDVTQPLPKVAVAAAQEAFAEMLNSNTFKGYGPEQGYDFLREVIAAHDFKSRGCDIAADEIFVSDGSKCDIGNFQELFSQDVSVGITDPVYPVYVDTNVMAGRAGGAAANGQYAGLVYLNTSAETNFLPEIPKQKIDLIYLCFPNNPTGAVASKENLKAWVDYAKKNGSIILFDAAYEAFITDPNIPHSIYEIEGAKECAVEFRSFSKNAGFTGTRCAYVVVPKELCGENEKGERVSIHSLWLRRQTTKFNGVSYPIQKAAAACYTPEGQSQTKQLVDYYMENAKIICKGLQAAGYTVFGGVNAPYIWLKTTGSISSWDFFDFWLNKINLVGTPGSGFGACGEGSFRLSAFGDRANVLEAIERIQSL